MAMYKPTTFPGHKTRMFLHTTKCKLNSMYLSYASDSLINIKIRLAFKRLSPYESTVH